MSKCEGIHGPKGCSLGEYCGDAVSAPAGKSSSPAGKHTPGPWTVGEDGDIYAGGACVAQVVGAPDGVAEAEANGRLIASAPALLAALEVADDFMNGPKPPAGIFSPGTREAVHEAIRAAIAMARGGK
jgi:hypothetical protein